MGKQKSPRDSNEVKKPSARTVPQVTDEESDHVDRLVRDVVIYLLIADRAKTVIKRQDIVKNILKVFV